MKQILSWKKVPLLVIACGFVLTAVFAQSHSGPKKQVTTDTLPFKEKKIRDLDEALAEIDRSEAEMQRALIGIDREKMESEMRKAMKNMETDMAKMKEEAAKAMKEIDMQKVQLEIQKAMKELDTEKIKQEVQNSLARIDVEKMRAELEKVKELDFSKMKEEMARIQPQVEKAMKEAKADIEKARKEINAYKNLVNALERDGMLNKKDHYKIEYKNKELTVNGRKLSEEATKKYSEHLSGKEDFILQKDENGLNINKQ